MFLLGLGIICVPLAVAAEKAVTGVRGPSNLIPYGGAYPHVGLLTHLRQFGVLDGGRNFPAGHASGGFALSALWAMPTRRLWRVLGLTVGLAAGWGMGIYQMARGGALLLAHARNHVSGRVRHPAVVGRLRGLGRAAGHSLHRAGRRLPQSPRGMNTPVFTSPP